MRRWLRSHLTYANVMVTILAFIVLTGGTAAALSGTNTVFTDDIADDTRPAGGGNPAGGLVAADLRPNSVGGSEVANNSLTGADVNESSLGQVPSARAAILGGTGRSSSGGGACNPESLTYLNCASIVTIQVPASANILVTGQATGLSDTGVGFAEGDCQLGSASHGPVPGSTVHLYAEGYSQVTTTAVWGPFPAGTYSFGIDCREVSDINFRFARVTAVALSAN
jgi:hypothetical protein